MDELRFCERCMMKTEHELIYTSDETSRRGRSLYRCKKCGMKSWKRRLRPSSEISY